MPHHGNNKSFNTLSYRLMVILRKVHYYFLLGNKLLLYNCTLALLVQLCQLRIACVFHHHHHQ